MTPEKAVELLRQVAKIDKDFNEETEDPTFLLIRLTREEGGIGLGTAIIDPNIPHQGDADVYFRLEPKQRLVIELAEIVNHIASSIRSAVTQAPMDKELWEHANHEKPKMFGITRHLTRTAVIKALEEKPYG